MKANPNTRLSKIGEKNPSAREVIIDDILYPAISVAAKANSITNNLARHRIISKHYPTYQYADGKGPNKKLANIGNANCKKIQINGKIYKSAVDAAKILNMNCDVLR